MKRVSTMLTAAAVLVLAACGQTGADTTSASAETTAAPIDTTAAPADTTTALTETTAAATETTEASTETTAAAAEDAFCGPALGLKTAMAAGPDVDFDSASREEIGAALAAFGALLAPFIEEIQAAAPPEIADDVTTVTDTVTEALESGDNALFESEEYVAADGAINDFLVANCGLESVSVSATEYEFTGIPDTLSAGQTVFEFSNGGQEAHEMVVFRINEGVPQSAEELFELPERRVNELVTDVGGTFALPGQSNTSLMNLEAGRYAFICFIPVGATPENLAALESGDFEGGPPHFTQGMVSELTVED